MSELSAENQTQDYIRLRRCILHALYEFFQEFPYGAMELRQIQESCSVSIKILNWNIVYLEKCGYVELDRSSDCPPYVSCTGSISAGGIDLIENTAVFENRFPCC